jgi:hypothetical protein
VANAAHQKKSLPVDIEDESAALVTTAGNGRKSEGDQDLEMGALGQGLAQGPGRQAVAEPAEKAEHRDKA